MSPELVGQLAPAVGAVAVAALAVVAGYLRRVAGRLDNVKADTAQLQRNSGSTLADKLSDKLEEVHADVRHVQRMASSNAEGLTEVGRRVTDHRRRNEQQIELLRRSVEERLVAMESRMERAAERRHVEPPSTASILTDPREDPT